MWHPASLHPHGALAVTLATLDVTLATHAVCVGARRDGLPQNQAVSAMRTYSTFCVSGGEGGAVAERHQRPTCFRHMCAALRGR
eukprot:2980005-Prymnesium_polylepis.1